MQNAAPPFRLFRRFTDEKSTSPDGGGLKRKENAGFACVFYYLMYIFVEKQPEVKSEFRCNGQFRAG